MWHKWFKLKGALSDFTPTGPRPYFEISAPHVRTQPWQLRSRKQLKMTQEHIQTKANTDKLCEIKQNQRYSPIKKKQRNLGVRFEPFPLLDFSPPLESCSDIYASPTSCLIVILLFNVLFSDIILIFFHHLSLSIVNLLISVLCTQTERSLLPVITRHAPLLLIGYNCGLGHGPTLWSKAFFKSLCKVKSENCLWTHYKC